MHGQGDDGAWSEFATDETCVPSLFCLSASVVSRNISLYQEFATMPPMAARMIVEAAKARGDLDLGALLKFAHVPLSELNLSSGKVGDEWAHLLASLPLRTLDLSHNPAITDDGIAMLCGMSSSPSKTRPSGGDMWADGGGFGSGRKPRRSSSNLSCGSGGGRRRRRSSNQSRSGDSTPVGSVGAAGGNFRQRKSLPRSLSDDTMEKRGKNVDSGSPESPYTPPASPLLPKETSPAAREESIVYVVLEEPSLVLQRVVLTGTSVSNSGLAPLAALPYLHTLELCDSDRVGNAAIEAISACGGLVSLTLRRCSKLSTGLQALTSLMHLRHLDVSGCAKVTDVCISPLLCSISSMTSLDLSMCPRITPSILPACYRAPSLSSLNLQGTGVRSSDVPGPTASPHGLSKLHRAPLSSISLSDVTLPLACLAPLAPFLTSLSLHRTLFCGCFACGGGGARGGAAACCLPDFGDDISALSLLASLTITRCHIPCASKTSPALPTGLISRLTSLNVSDSAVDNMTLSHLLRAGTCLRTLSAASWIDAFPPDHPAPPLEPLPVGPLPLERLDIQGLVSWDDDGSVGIQSFGCLGEGSLARLRELVLRRCECARASDIEKLSRLAPSLSVLDLSRCRGITSADLISLPRSLTALLARGLRCDTGAMCVLGEGAEELDVEGSNVTAEALTVALSGGNGVKRLRLSGCCSLRGGSTGREFGDCLPRDLTHMDISGCMSLDDGAIAYAVGRCTSLQELSVVGCRYGDESAAAVASLASLRVLCVHEDDSHREPPNPSLTDHGRSLLYSLSPTIMVTGLARGWISVPRSAPAGWQK